MKKGSLLVVDDNIQILKSLQILLEPEFLKVESLKNPNLIPARILEESFDVILLDMNFASGDTSGNEGLFWLREILGQDPGAVVIFMTAYGDIDLAVKGIKEGATDFITKPWDAEKLITTLRNACELKRSRQQLRKLRDRQKQMNDDMDRNFRMVTGNSPAFNRVLDTLEKISRTEVDVLITGENGTGKELVARDIHRRSDRSGEVFVPVDLGSLSETLFESEMFGHVKGAFTDAREDRQGRFEMAEGGTLFLDEIGNLSLNLQSKLLQVIQNRQVTRVGSSRSRPVNVRIISATNKSLAEMVQEGSFREDLFFRLNTVTIDLPPLRQRLDDIPLFANHFLDEFARKYEKPYLRIGPRAMEKLARYRWPGNIRELKHSIEKAVILCDGKEISAGDLFLETHALQASREPEATTLAEIEKNAILDALARCHANYSLAAKMLDISRTTLYAKMKKYGL